MEPLFRCLIFFLFKILTSMATVCFPPDVPYGGSYVPMQPWYLPGDKITYVCKERFTRIGKDTRSCQPIGKWSGQTPFCDVPAKIKNPRASTDPFNAVSKVIDGSPNTCFRSRNATGQSLQVFLTEPNAVYLIYIFLMKGIVNLQISTVCRGLSKLCATYDRDIEEDQWVKLYCYDNRKGIESLRIVDISPRANAIAICEIEVYTEDDVWCRNPPEVFIPNGYLEVSRDRATLRCADGYKEGDNSRLVCDKNSTWSGPNLQCNEILCESLVGNDTSLAYNWWLEGEVKTPSVGSQKKLHCISPFVVTGSPDIVTCLNNGSWTSTNAICKRKPEEKSLGTVKIIGIAVGIVIVLMIFVCLGLVLFCIHKQKTKQVVVVYSSDDTTAASLQGMSASEAEYSTVYYEAAAPPYLPVTLPPLPRNITARAYSKPVDSVTPIMDQQRPADIAFGTLKASEIYGS